MIVNHEERKYLRSRRIIQGSNKKYELKQIYEMEINRNEQNQRQYNHRDQQKNLQRGQTFQRQPLQQILKQNTKRGHSSKYQSFIMTNKRQGFIKSNVNKSITNSGKQSKSKNQKSQSIKKCMKSSKYDKMSYDIDLSNKRIKQFLVQLPSKIDYRQIYSLNFSQNQIKQILPMLLVPFQSLRELKLNKNNLQKISFPYNKMKLKYLQINQNRISNLNLQHLGYLESVDASKNKLIFVTLPESLKKLNVEQNLISNMYFIQKCLKIESLNLNYNLVYDLNFNSYSQVQTFVKNKAKIARYPNLTNLQCRNNQICHLNGFINIRQISNLNISFNELVMNRQNLNEILQLQSIEVLNLSQNPLEGLYSLKTAYQFFINRFLKLKFFNQSPLQKYLQSITTSKSKSQEQNFQQEQRQLQIDQNSSILNSSEKPIRLFLDEETQTPFFTVSSKEHTNQLTSKQRIYTLGDSQSKIQIFNQSNYSCKINLPKNNIFQIQSSTSQNSHSFKKQKLLPSQNVKYSILNQINPKQKIFQLQDQILSKNKNVQIKSVDFLLNQNVQLQNSHKINLLKMILELSFIPPEPIKNTSEKCIVSKRLDEDDDQFMLFTKLFEKEGGIFYLKKIFLLEDNDRILQTERSICQNQYSLSFFNHPQINTIYRQMSNQTIVLSDAVKKIKQGNSLSNIEAYLSTFPGEFGYYHIAVRHLSIKKLGFEKKNQTPVCYLIQSKKL